MPAERKSSSPFGRAMKPSTLVPMKTEVVIRISVPARAPERMPIILKQRTEVTAY